jgi:hypothetical protein
MTEQSSEPEIVFILGGIVLLLGVIIVGISAGSVDNEQVFVQSFDAQDSNISGEQNARIVSSENGQVVIEGSVTGSSSEMKPVLKRVERINGSDIIEVNIEAERKSSSEVVLPAFYNYRYEMTLSGVDENDQIVVKYGNESFNLSTENVNTNMSNKNPQFNFEKRATDSASTNEKVSIDKEDDKTKIKGIIVGSTGAQSAYLANTETNDSTITVDVRLKEADGFATQVITGYGYEVSVTEFEDFENIVVEHGGKKVEKFGVS